MSSYDTGNWDGYYPTLARAAAEAERTTQDEGVVYVAVSYGRRGWRVEAA